MFASQNRINKILFYFFTMVVLVSVILIWGFSLPNALSANDKVKEKENKVVEQKETKGEKEDKSKEDKDKEDKEEEKIDKKEDKEEEKIDKKEDKEEEKIDKKEDKEEEKIDKKEDKEEEKIDKKEDKEEEKIDKKEDKNKEEKDKDKGLKTYHITASCSHGGSISPSGNQKINEEESLTFTCTADEGFNLVYLRVDNIKIEGITSYTFTDVDKNHTIHAIFRKIKDSTGDPDNEDDKQSDSGGDSNDGSLDNHNNNLIVFCSTFFVLKNINSLKIKEKSSNHIKTKKIEKLYDKKCLFDIIEINDINQLLDINAITKKNEITEILDVDDIINEGNYIEIWQLDLNIDNPFISAFIFIWGKIKDFSYYYNT